MNTKEKVKPIAVANTFIKNYAGNEGIDHMKLQKLTYLTYGWWLAKNDEPFIAEEPEVWEYGPVFSSLYRALKEFRSIPITSPQSVSPDEEVLLIKEGNQKKIIDWVWNKYKDFTGVDLSNITHEKDSPWRKIAEKHNFKEFLEEF